MDAVIFDFNGTLFLDSDKHEEAWRLYLEKLTGRVISDEDIKKNTHGRINDEILSFYAQRELSQSEIANMGDEKEHVYRQLCLADPDCLTLIRGAKEFFEFLQGAGIPFTIATASGEDNVDFYFKMLGLETWFQRSNVVFNDGTIQGKPEPDLYLKAAKVLGVAPENCVVFEDAVSGIKAADAANAEKIIAIASTFPSDYLMTLESVDRVIDSFEGTKEFYKELLGC